ncbi:tryptase alpha/beta-1-like [Asbolus verrucosus]|uniref:Phenoloxidase-activating factor 2 n=1 Tax=Asbolus verrucosus TaxID=1661398 RepID=A0A482W623_ASBVE|nr:tryptase alpha/beta-1-like [Asbolus verrucosus]
MKFLFLIFTSLVCAQQDPEDAINNIFSNNGTFDDFLRNYEEVTQPPLKSLAALTKCGEGDQKDRFVCVPYYNCDPSTNTVQANPAIDGTNKINIRSDRMRSGEDDNYKCDHYMEICCQLPQADDGGNIPPPVRPTAGPSSTETAIVTRPTPPSRAFCGIRNSQGLDFNLVGKTNEALFGEFPWMVAILRKNPAAGQNLAICGGSLISPRVVLTGAHCVEKININEIKIRAGEWDTQTQNERIPYQERNIVQKIMHKDFSRGNLYNDLALLILDRQLTKTDSVGTICLPKQDQKFNSRDCFATGWGKDVFGQAGRYAVILKKIQLPVVQNADCQRALRRTRLGDSFVLHRSFICAGGEPGVDTCTGDGGSPLVCPDPNNPSRYVQVGIVAWGIGCGENQVPGVYADVTQFRNWVDLKLQELDINTASYN